MPAPVVLDVSPVDGGRVRFGLRNVTDSPVEVVADRRLLSFVATSPEPAPARGRRRAPRLARCAHDQRPVMNEFSPRVTLEAGQRYSEEVDVADLCGLRTPALGAGALEFHYGFAAPRRGAVSHSRSIVTDERAATFAEVTAPAPASLVATAPADGAGDATPTLLSLAARGSSAPTAAGLRVGATLRNPSVQAAWVLFRPMQFSLVVTPPSGRDVACDSLTRQPSPLRDLFVRLPSHASRGGTLVPALMCPPTTFAQPGVYRVRVRFESRADGEAYGFQRVFTGVAESASIPVRVSRGQIVPLRPQFE